MTAELFIKMWSALLGVTNELGRDEEGQTMAEYGLLLAGIAVAVVVTVFALGTAIDGTFQDILARF